MLSNLLALLFLFKYLISLLQNIRKNQSTWYQYLLIYLSRYLDQEKAK